MITIPLVKLTSETQGNSVALITSERQRLKHESPCSGVSTGSTLECLLLMELIGQFQGAF